MTKITPHYGIPARPYAHGEAKIKLVFCPSCRCWMKALHPCPARSDDDDD